MKHLATFRKEGSDVGTSVHGTGQDVRVVVERLGLANQASENTGKCDSFLNCTSGRRGSQGLQVEWQVVLDRGG